VGDSIKDRLSNFSSFGRLRLQVSHGTIIAYSALFLIIFIAFTIRILALRWENLTEGTALLNEFDPYYQFSITKYMVDNGPLSPYYPTPWINMQKWYPDGLDMSLSLPALPMTGWAIFSLVSLFGVNFDLMTFCAVLPAFIAAIACIIIYFIGKDMGGRTVGLFAALFLALAPSFLQRSSLGFYDTEVPGVIGLILFVFFFLRSLDGNRSLRASLLYSLGAGAALAYFIAGWGAAYFIIGLSVLFVFIMVLLRRYSQRMLISYSITFGLALFIGTKIPYINLSYLVSGAVLPVVAVFIVLLIAEVLRNNISARSKLILTAGTIVGIVGSFAVLGATGALGGIAGKFITVLNPFIRASSPLIDSVAEQRISAWGNLYIELGISILFFLVGLYFTIRNPSNRNIFMLVFASTSLYFATSMVRILVLFAPAFAIIAAIGIIAMLKPFFTLLKEVPGSLAKSKRRLPRVSKEYSGVVVFIIFILLMSNLAFSPQTGGMPRVVNQAYSPTAISASSLPVGGSSLTAPVSAWLDAVEWLRGNVPSSTAVVMWWDYGNWLADLGNVTSLADNTTVNSTKIQDIGFIFMANENQSMTMLSNYGQNRVKYIAVFEVLYVAQTSSGSNQWYASPAGFGDEGKWSWMARISAQGMDRIINAGYISRANAWTDNETVRAETYFGSTNQQSGQFEWNDHGLNSTVYELMNYAEVQYCLRMSEALSASAGTTVTVTPHQDTTDPTYFKEAYFAGTNISPYAYGGLVPIIAIYEIDWDAWNAAQGT
jgi:dolichyl-diphosphooligosaccharide---protein glycosyltransferase